MRHVLHRTPPTLPGLAAIAVFATCGTASAQALFTTLNSAKVTLNSLDGTPTSSYWTYTGPTSDTGGSVLMTSFAQPNTGHADVRIGDFAGLDGVIMNYNSPTFGMHTFSVRFEWDVTFSSAQGGVILGLDTGVGTQTVTPFGGSAGSIGVGDFLANGRYLLVWEHFDTAFGGYGAQFRFAESTGGGGAVPLPGAAGLAAIGLVGLSRRRRL